MSSETFLLMFVPRAQSQAMSIMENTAPTAEKAIMANILLTIPPSDNEKSDSKQYGAMSIAKSCHAFNFRNIFISSPAHNVMNHDFGALATNIMSSFVGSIIFRISSPIQTDHVSSKTLCPQAGESCTFRLLGKPEVVFP